ncbi:MAG: hypothetical protein ABJL67_09275 [Sulfitobacter sp.]
MKLREHIRDAWTRRIDGANVQWRNLGIKAQELNNRGAFYLCQTKGCEAYGKSIKRDTLEGDVGEMIKALQPTENLKTLATAMFRHIWDIRRTQAKALKAEAKKKLKEMDKRVETLLEHIMNAKSEAIVPVYEGEIIALERGKAVLTEQMHKQTEPNGTFEEKLEPALTFLSNPWKLWETGHVVLRRVVLKLAFADRIKYCRNKGARTPEIAFPFKALDAFSTSVLRNGARGRNRTTDTRIFNARHGGLTP